MLFISDCINKNKVDEPKKKNVSHPFQNRRNWQNNADKSKDKKKQQLFFIAKYKIDRTVDQKISEQLTKKATISSSNS